MHGRMTDACGPPQKLCLVRPDGIDRVSPAITQGESRMVRGMVGVLLALLVMAAPGAAGAQGGSKAETMAGAAAYAEACAACHRTPARFMRRHLDKTAAEREAHFEAFLSKHYAPEPATRAAIIAWLEANHTSP